MAQKKFYGIKAGKTKIGVNTDILTKSEKALKELGEGLCDTTLDKKIKKDMKLNKSNRR